MNIIPKCILIKARDAQRKAAVDATRDIGAFDLTISGHHAKGGHIVCDLEKERKTGIRHILWHGDSSEKCRDALASIRSEYISKQVLNAVSEHTGFKVDG